MKRNAWVFLVISVLALMSVTGCSQDEDQFIGEWTRITNDNWLCPIELIFYEKGLLHMEREDNDDVTGTIKKLEGDKYTYDLKVLTEVIELKLQEDGTLLLVDGKLKCTYKKKQ
ncbi:hypothetical protein [Staphylospora marina]|uniref:hypothetical protein n=1 Tax=Staphylospora marina TaxID=2490858 RepID=UPI000F5BD0BE|nr:hypothetical protein [Staphylospora marina]